MTIEQQDKIFHPFKLEQFLHYAASHCVIQDGRCKKFHHSKMVTTSSGRSMLKLLTTQGKFPADRHILIISVFFRLSSRPIQFYLVIQLCTSLRTDSGEQPIISSSRYQTFRSYTTPLPILFTASVNRRGLIGYPCWSPDDEVIE